MWIGWGIGSNQVLGLRKMADKPGRTKGLQVMFSLGAAIIAAAAFLPVLRPAGFSLAVLRKRSKC